MISDRQCIECQTPLMRGVTCQNCCSDWERLKRKMGPEIHHYSSIDEAVIGALCNGVISSGDPLVREWAPDLFTGLPKVATAEWELAFTPATMH